LKCWLRDRGSCQKNRLCGLGQGLQVLGQGMRPCVCTHTHSRMAKGKKRTQLNLFRHTQNYTLYYTPTKPKPKGLLRDSTTFRTHYYLFHTLSSFSPSLSLLWTFAAVRASRKQGNVQTNKDQAVCKNGIESYSIPSKYTRKDMGKDLHNILPFCVFEWKGMIRLNLIFSLSTCRPCSTQRLHDHIPIISM